MSALLSLALNDVDVSMPVANPCTTDVRVVEAKIENGKKDANIQMIVFKFETLYELKDTKGNVLKPGWKGLSDRIVITPTGELTEEKILQSLKRFQLAAGRTGAFGDPASYIGAVLPVKLAVEEDKNGVYPPKNLVRYIEKK